MRGRNVLRFCEEGDFCGFFINYSEELSIIYIMSRKIIISYKWRWGWFWKDIVKLNGDEGRIDLMLEWWVMEYICMRKIEKKK
jgi:hypothetical protein